MVGGEVFLNPQGPEAAEKREDGGPGQLQITVAQDLSAADPFIDRRERASQDGVERLRRIQLPKPAAERGRVRHAMGILHRRCRRFPGTVLDKVAPQRLTARDQAVMRVRERKPRQEGDRLAARLADASPDHNPVRHPPQSGWLDELGRLKGGRSVGLDAARCASYFMLQNCPLPSAASCSRMYWRTCSSSNPTVDTA